VFYEQSTWIGAGAPVDLDPSTRRGERAPPLIENRNRKAPRRHLPSSYRCGGGRDGAFSHRKSEQKSAKAPFGIALSMWGGERAPFRSENRNGKAPRRHSASLYRCSGARERLFALDHCGRDPSSPLRQLGDEVRRVMGAACWRRSRVLAASARAGPNSQEPARPPAWSRRWLRLWLRRWPPILAAIRNHRGWPSALKPSAR
jgi:hypothetical protein